MRMSQPRQARGPASGNDGLGAAGGVCLAVLSRGYRARFPDGLEILDESGAVVLRQGDQVEVACVGPDELLLLTPPFR